MAEWRATLNEQRALTDAVCQQAWAVESVAVVTLAELRQSGRGSNGTLRASLGLSLASLRRVTGPCACLDGDCKELRIGPTVMPHLPHCKQATQLTHRCSSVAAARVPALLPA